MKPATRRRVRTAVLGVVAFVALLWGAVDIVGVPVRNLWSHLGDIAVGMLLLVLLAAVPGALLQWRRQRRRSGP